MNIATSRITHSLPLFNALFPFSLGVQKFGFLSLLQERRRFRGATVKMMAWTVEKCNGNLVNKIGLVRPAIEDYAEEAIEAIKAGKVIAVPTDTLYGFACDAWYWPYLDLNFVFLLAVKVSFFFSVPAFIVACNMGSAKFDSFKRPNWQCAPN